MSNEASARDPSSWLRIAVFAINRTKTPTLKEAERGTEISGSGTKRLLAKCGFFEIKEFEVNGLGDCFHSFELHPAFVLFDTSKHIDSLLEESKRTGATVNSLIGKEPAFTQKTLLFERNLSFNLERLFVDSMITDRAIMLEWKERGGIKSMKDGVTRFVAAWENMQSFYSIEGFVGSFNKRGSKESGTLDVLENLLPGIDTKTEKGKQIALCLASVVGRDFKDIEHAVEVLKHIKGEKKADEDEVLRLVREFRNTELKTNGEVASFFNGLIRFHNWMGLRLKAGDELGDTFDSVCVPANSIASKLGNPEILSMKDATSPKGIATVKFIEENGDKSLIKEALFKSKKLKQELLREKERFLRDFVIIDSEDPFFPHSLVGGKAQGLKSLKEAIDVLQLSLKVPRFIVVSRIGLERPALLEKRLSEMDLGWVGIARSSAIGEDSHSNFAGVFESVELSESTNLTSAIERVAKSFTSEEAGKIKGSVGTPKEALGGIVLQEEVEGEGIVLFLKSKDDVSLSLAGTPSGAVNGKGAEFKGSLDFVLGKAGLTSIKTDLIKLFDTFGQIDLELVKNENVHVVQMRRVAKASNSLDFPESADKIEVQKISDIRTLLRAKKVIRINDSLNVDRDKVVDFVLCNKENVAGVESHDNETSHIANLLMGLGVPFRKIE